jgi:hypothetical protein
MKKILTNKKFDDAIKWIKNNPYTEEIVNVSDVELLESREKVVVSVVQGDYPVAVKFTAMQKIEVIYKNKYYGLSKDIIVAGFDATRYKECRNNMYEGEYLDDSIISIEFVGEYCKTIDTIRL